MDKTERLEAIGSRGEACIIVRTWTAVAATANSDDQADDEQGLPSYRLATGERLNPTNDPTMFETHDGSRQFTLR